MPTLDTLQLPRIDTAAYGGREAKKIAGHLYQVEEQLRYVLGHLDEDNLSDGLKSKIESGGMSSAILQSLDAITLRVSGQDDAMAELRVGLGGITSTVQEQGGAITRLEQTAQGLTGTVQANKELSEQQAAAALETALKYTDTRLEDYPTSARMSSALQQTAESITTTVAAVYSTKDELQSTVEQRAESITSTVEANFTTKAETKQVREEAAADAAAKADAARDAANKDTDDKLKNYSTTVEMRSAIEQTAGSITSTVQEVKKTADTAGEKVTKIEQTVDGLRLEASSFANEDFFAGTAWTNGTTVTNDGGSTTVTTALYVPLQKLSDLSGRSVTFSIEVKSLSEAQKQSLITIWTNYRSGNISTSLATNNQIASAKDWTKYTATIPFKDETPTSVYIWAYAYQGYAASFAVRNAAALVQGARSTTLTLKSGETVLTSANITLNGVVTFQNLENDGETVINGSNIKTGVIQNSTETTAYDLDNGTIRMGAPNSTRVLITRDVIRWYDGVDPTGIFESKRGFSYIGANSGYTYYGWLPRDEMTGEYYGMRIEESGNAHFNTSKVECGGCKDDNDGTLEAWTIHASGVLEVPAGGKSAVVPTKEYGVLRMICAESPIPQFFDNGSGVIDETGKCYLFLRDEFLSTVSCHVVPQWHVTAAAPVTVRKDGLCAIVEGAPGTTFDWLCILPQIGCESMYCERSDYDWADSMDRRDCTAEEELNGIERFEQSLGDEVLKTGEENAFIEETWPEQVERSVYA